MANVLGDVRRNLKKRLSFLRRRLVRPRRPVHADGKLLLHIGCGPIDSPEFVNVDAVPYAHVHVVTESIDELSEFADEAVDLVYMCHVLEHIKTPQVKRVLQEMRRVLKPDGVLRLSVPDFDRLVAVYEAAGGDLEMIRKQLMGGQDSEYNIHYGLFNRRSLSGLLQEIGFRVVRPWDPRDCQYHDFKDKANKVVTVSGESFEISLNLEAVK